MFNSNASSAASGDVNYIEDVFSTYLYTGNNSSQTITNGIDLSGKGGLVWIKSRNTTYSHILSDTVRGTGKFLSSNTTDAQGTDAQDVSAFNSTGFTVGNNSRVNNSSFNYASWTFREQPKFFDVVTYTGNGTTNNVAHSLASVPGMVIIKKTSTTSNWWTLNRNSSGNYLLGYLNSTGSLPQVWASANTSTYLTSTTINVNSIASISGEDMNASGDTYVAYIFAHDAGGFGLTGTDNVISCGSFTSNGSGEALVNLGYEPQWVMIKNSTGTAADWVINDSMRGMSVTTDANLSPNTSGAESSVSNQIMPNATGFSVGGGIVGVSTTYIYVAIRRGPMKVPTDGTKVFTPNAWTGTGGATIVPAGFPIDMVWIRNRSASGGIGGDGYDFDRLRGNANALVLNSNAAEDSSWGAGYDYFDNSTGFGVGVSFFNNSGTNYIDWMFRRAPSFFDEVCYTGNNAVQNVTHNLGVVPELMIVKGRNQVISFGVYASSLGATKYLILNTTDAAAVDSTLWNDTAPTSTVFTAGTLLSSTGNTFVAYLFATCAGVSKVGSYTGTATTQQINCGFAAGARFVLIKRTDSTGDWYVWDSARGIVAGNDPYLLLNTTAAEVTSTDYVDTYAAGFELTSTAPAALNASGGSYIFLAIA